MPFSLDVTKKEMELLQSLSEISQSLAENPDNAMLLGEQNALREELESLQEGKSIKTAYAQLMEEHQTLTKQFNQLKEQVETLQHASGPLTDNSISTDKQRLSFYRAILEKFSPLLQEKATKTVGEIKALVDEDDLTVQMLAEEFRSDEEMSFWEKLSAFCIKLREHVQIVQNDSAINCWFTPQEIMENKVADDEDVAVLVAAVSKALGADDVFVVIVELNNNQPHAFNLVKKDEKWAAIDASQPEKEPFPKNSTMEEALDSFRVGDEPIKRALYRFNRESYEQFF